MRSNLDEVREQIDQQAAFEAMGQVRLERHHAQLVRLNEWLQEHANDLYQTNPGDSAELMIMAADRLREQVAGLRHELAAALDEHNTADRACADLEEDLEAARRELDALIAERDGLRQQLAQMDPELRTLRSYAIAAAVQVAAQSAQPADPILFLPVEQAADILARDADILESDADILESDDLRDWIIGLDAKRHTWRTIPKPVRWRLITATLRSIWKNGRPPSMDDFNAAKPEWMPISSSVAMSYGDGKWTTVCDKAAQP